jgi:MPBQ/MSBQ methyltransferase
MKKDMRKAALEPAKLDSPDLDVVDVGGGTGFCTIGIVQAGVKVVVS